MHVISTSFSKDDPRRRNSDRHRRIGRKPSLFLVLTLCGMLLSYSVPQSSAAYSVAASPVVIAISPRQVYNDQATTITITGAGFVDTPIVTASSCASERLVLGDVTLVNSMTLTATVPANLTEGVDRVTVTNPDGQSDMFTNFVVMRRGDGSFGPWTMTSSMTAVRWNFAAVAANGYAYALGGNGQGSNIVLSSVERAKINLDGSLGAWQVAGALTTQRAGLAAVAVGNYLYALGGESGFLGLYQSSVERAVIKSDGSLGAWQVVSSMTTPRLSPAAVAAHGYLYVLGGYPGGNPAVNSVERAALKPDGSLGPWELTASMTMPRSNAVAVGQYIYALGGDNSVERSTVNSDGSLEPWQIVSSMVAARGESATVVAKGHVYVLGGLYPCQTNRVESAVINSDSSLGPWELTTSMLEARSGFAAAALDGWIYALGGRVGSLLAEPSVEYASARNLSQQVFLPAIGR